MTKWKSNDFLYVKLRTRLDTILRRLWRRQVEAALGFSPAIKKVVQADNRASCPQALAHSPARLQLNLVLLLT